MSRILEKPRTVISPEHCKGCGLCVMACPKDCLAQLATFNSKGYHPSSYKGEGCTGCGMCYYSCPEPAAITVYKKGAEYPDD